MAALYGKLQGQRGEATRLGSANSGIRCSLETWKGRIGVSLRANGDFNIYVTGKGNEDFCPVATGNVDEGSRAIRLTDHGECLGRDADSLG